MYQGPSLTALAPIEERRRSGVVARRHGVVSLQWHSLNPVPARRCHQNRKRPFSELVFGGTKM